MNVSGTSFGAFNRLSVTRMCGFVSSFLHSSVKRGKLCVFLFTGDFFVSVFIMPVFKCVFSREGHSCLHEFSCDGHSLCVPHRPCVSEDFVFDPEACAVCSENVKFLRTVGHVDRLSQQFSSLKKSWDAVQKSARRNGVSPSWLDSSLREFVLGRGTRRSRSSETSASSCFSSPVPSFFVF